VDVDLGGPSAPGSAVTNSDGSVTVSGNGADIWNDTDQCNYYYTWTTASQWAVAIKMDVDIVSTGSTWAKCEVMCRKADPVLGPQPGDPFIAMMYTKTVADAGVGVLRPQFRCNPNEEADEWAGTQPATAYAVPTWIQLKRNGSVFSCLWSTDGVNWTDELDADTANTSFEAQNGSDDPTQASWTSAWPDTVAVGIAVTSHNNVATDTAVATFNFVTNNLPPFTPPTVVSAAVQNKNCTNYAGCEASFTFVATNNATPYIPFMMGSLESYQWYKNGTAVAGATGTSLTWLIDPADSTQNGTETYCKVTLAPPWNLNVTNVYSTTNSLTVIPGVVYYTNGVKMEFFAGANLGQLEAGDVGPANWISVESAFQNPGGLGDNYADRESGWFIPPTTDKYVFFVASDDQSDLFLNMTGPGMAGKTLIAQEQGWSGYNNWLTSGDGAATSSAQKRSDQWTLGAVGINPPYANGIALNAGQPYYIELDHNQGGGGDDMSVTYQTVEQVANANWATVFTNGTPSIISAANGDIELASWAATYIKFSQPPQNLTVAEAAAGTFTAVAVSDSEFAPLYQWYRAGQPITGATTTSYITPVTALGDNGAQFFVVASLPENGLSVTSSVVTLAVTSGIWEPGFCKVDWWYYNGNDATENIAALESGSLGLPNITVAAPQYEARAINNTGPNYDHGKISGWVVPPATGPYTFYVCSDDAADLFLSTDATIANMRMVAQEQGWSNPLQWLTANGGLASQKDSDTFVPPTAPTGSSPPYPNGITLVKGKQYYIEADHYNGTGGDNVQATALPTGTSPAAGDVSQLAGSYIGYYFPRCTYVAFTQQPVSVTNVAPFSDVTFTANGITDSKIGIMGADYPEAGLTNFMFFQWTVNGTAVAGANTSSFTTVADPWLNNAQIVCQMRALGYANAAGTPIWSNSTTVTLTIGTNNLTPAISYATVFQQNGGKTVLDIKFNKPMDPTSLLNATYTTAPSLSLGTPNIYTNASPKYLSVGSQVLTHDQFASIQFGLFSTPTGPVALTVTGAKDAWGNALTANTATIVAGPALADTDIGTPPSDPIVPGLLWVNGPNSFTIQCEGSDIWNAADGCNFASQQVSGDFDIVVQVLDITHADTWSKAGLMVRQSLDAGSREWCIITTPNSADNIQSADASGYGVNNILSYCRNAQDAASVAWTTGDSNGNGVGYANKTPQYPNVWLRLKRVGQVLTSFYSVDGFHWVPSSTDNPSLVGDATPLVDPVYVGICQTSHANDANAVAWTSLARVSEDDYANYNASYVEMPAVQPVPAVNTATPAIAFATYYTNNNLVAGPEQVVDLKFNKTMNPASLLAATYKVSGLTVTGVTVYTNESVNISPTSQAVSNNYSSVLLTVTGTPSSPLNITVTGAQDYWGTALTANTASASLCALINQDIGTLGADPAVPGVMWVNGPNSYTIQCEGSDIWNNADGCNFSYTELTGDFDVVVRVTDNTHASNWSKAGLMVRESLAANSREWSIINDPDSADGIMSNDGATGASDIEINCRNTTAAGTGGWQVVTNGMVPAYPNAWVRLQRTGTQLAAYFSTNGTAWVQGGWDDPTTVGAKTALPNTVYVGICQTAHNNDQVPPPPLGNLAFLDTVDYDNFNAAYAVAPSTVMSITRSGANVIISWTPAGGTLLSSPALGTAAVWTPVANATNPMTIPIGKADQFFRVQD
jgi:hypothetical protein